MDAVCYPEPEMWSPADSGTRLLAGAPRVVIHWPATGSLRPYVVERVAITGGAEIVLLGFIDEPQTLRHTPAQNLQRIQEVFKPAMTELAALFGVSRQALYNWRNGETPRADQIDRLEDLARCADVVAAASLPSTGRLLTRKVFDGRSLFDIVRAGEPALDFAERLVQLVGVEARSRDRLNTRFRGRAGRTDFAEFATPTDDIP